MAVDNVIIARRFLEEIWSKGNLEIVDDIVHRDASMRDPFMPEGKGPGDVRTLVRMMREAFPDLTVTVADPLVAGDRVSLRWHARGTHRGPLGNISPTQRSTTIQGVALFRFKNGMISECIAYWDTYAMYQQLGVLPTFDRLGKSAAPVSGTSTARV